MKENLFDQEFDIIKERDLEFDQNQNLNKKDRAKKKNVIGLVGSFSKQIIKNVGESAQEIKNMVVVP